MGGMTAYTRRKMDGVEVFSKCLICDGNSIFEVQFVTENFSSMLLGTDLEIVCPLCVCI